MNNPKIRNKNIVVQEFANEILIYDLKINKAFCLNETSALIYQLCNGNNSVAGIAQILSNELKQLISEDLIWLALDQFKRDNLLENNDVFAINFNSLSRRQVIKKVGLASMVGLPLVSSVIAPRAIDAQSQTCQSENQSCIFDNLTQSNCCSGLRCNGSGQCIPCLTANSFYGVAINCNADFRQNICCNSSAPITQNGTQCFCG